MFLAFILADFETEDMWKQGTDQTVIAKESSSTADSGVAID